MLKQFPKKTRLIIAGTALVAVAVFAALSLTSNDNGQPYVPNYPYMPKPDGQDGKPTETAVGPFECGEMPSSPKTSSDGWVVENNQYLCLTVSHPEDWRLIEPRNVPLIGQTYPMMLQEVRSGQLERPVAIIYPLHESESLAPFIDDSMTEIRSQQTNIGTAELPVYEFELVADPMSGDKLLQYFLMDVKALNRTYLIIGYHSKNEVAVTDKIVMRKMVLELSAY